MLKFSIVTPDGVVYEDNIEKVSIPTTMGEITVLPHHIPLLAVAAAGELKVYKDTGEPVEIAISGGMVEVHTDNSVSILADTAERAEHIDVERAEAARTRAIELLKQVKEVNDLEFARMQAKMEKELARLRVGRKYRKLPPPTV